MATRKKTAKKKAGSEAGPKFEQALEELESLVEAMENEQLPLEELVANYEKGSKLISHCQLVLESARERIELITLGNQDESGLENAPSADDVGGGAPPASQGNVPPASQGNVPPASQGNAPPASQGNAPPASPKDDDDIRLF